MNDNKLVFKSICATLIAFILCMILIAMGHLASGGDDFLETMFYLFLVGGLTTLPPYFLINLLFIFTLKKYKIVIKKIAILWCIGGVIMIILSIRSTIQNTYNEYIFYIFLLIVSTLLNVFFVLKKEDVIA